MDPRRIQAQFFSSDNEKQLIQSVLGDFQKRSGTKLTEKQETRLERTITHYMDEVWEANGPLPIQNLNREVIGATVTDFTTYLRRNSEQPSMVNAVKQVVNMPQRPFYQESDKPQLTLETGERYEQVQKERTVSQQKAPRVPDFRISLDDSNIPSPLEQFEAAKKARELEAVRQIPTGLTANTQNTPFINRVNSDPIGNPTTSLPSTNEVRSNLQQDIIIKQESIVSYKEVEENLFIYSADRDWLNNTTQSRYNFTINFDVANNRQGFGLGTTATKKFKNIVRIELVKVIIPAEGLEPVMTVNTFTNGTSTGALATTSSTAINALSFPYVTLRIPELDGNNYGSDNSLDNAFGIVQYDANWNTDNNLTDGRGFLAMIPKFLKCQKSYHPTPLSTLTKLTFQIQRPTGGFLSDISDSFRVYSVCTSVLFNPVTTTSKYSGTNLTDTLTTAGNSLYYLVRTYECFSRFTFTKGDRVLLNGIDTSVVTGGTPSQAALADLKTWLEDPNGHVLVDLGFIGSSGSTLVDGFNAAGYANVLIFQAPIRNDATNVLSLATTPYIPAVRAFGGSTANNKSIETGLGTAVFTSGRILNLSHQTQIVLRVITRELDPTSRVRPDNM